MTTPDESRTYGQMIAAAGRETMLPLSDRPYTGNDPADRERDLQDQLDDLRREVEDQLDGLRHDLEDQLDGLRRDLDQLDTRVGDLEIEEG